MSSVGIPGGGEGCAAAAGKQYYCHQCERHVTITSPTSATAEVLCPICNGGFLEESETDPPSNPTNIINDTSNNTLPASGSFPIIFSSSSAAPGGASFLAPSAGGYEDLSSLFAARSPNELNPFTFLSDSVSNFQASGENIHLVFESPGVGGNGDFRLPENLGLLIQQLAGIGRYGTPPASKSAVEGLPDLQITEEMLASDSSLCAVCKDKLQLNEVGKQMPCKHIYHKDCIFPWLELHNTCPVCRYQMPTDDPDHGNGRTGRMNYNGNRNSNRGLGAAGGSQETRDDGSNNPQTPITVERRFRLSLPALFRGVNAPAETSSSLGGGGSNDGGNSGTNNSSSGASSRSSGAGGEHARQEDLD